MGEALKEIAWNGIQLSVPAAWEIARLENRHLTLNHHGCPAMEIKWRAIKGRFSHRVQIKKLTKRQRNRSGRHIRAWQMPPAWQQALKTFSSSGFCWQSGTQSGHGATLYCPACRNATIFQFFDSGERLADPVLLRTLETLSDHRGDNLTAWRIFDMQALLPDSFRLKRFHFKPGNHMLAFSDRYTTIQLYRWAPASALLMQAGLAAFAAGTLELDPDHFRRTAINGHAAVEWRSHQKTGWRGHFYGLRSKPAFHWAAVWHLQEDNRLLGFRFESRRPLETDQMTRISNNFQLNAC